MRRLPLPASRRRAAVAVGAVVALAAASAPAAAQGTVYWTDWTTFTLSTASVAGSASGTVNVSGTNVGVSYAGEVNNNTRVNSPYPSWLPRSSYLPAGYTDATTPPRDIIALTGGTSFVSTLTFSQAITNPIISLWSLGANGNPIDYVFSAPFQILAGGPSQEYPSGGAPTNPSGNVLRGIEANGSVRFVGTFTTLSWTVVGDESWHGFTLGVQGLADGPPPTVVPEPSTVALTATGLLALGAAVRRRRRPV